MLSVQSRVAYGHVGNAASVFPPQRLGIIDAAIALASYPQEIRGYGPVKEKSIARVEPMAKALRLRFSENRETN